MKKYIVIFILYLFQLLPAYPMEQDEILPTQPPAAPLMREGSERDGETRALLADAPLLEDDLQTREVAQLFDYLEDRVFNPQDHGMAIFLRWTGRLMGAMADNAMVPMILYVTLGLINAPTSGWVDWTIISVMLAYLLIPAMENMAQMGQDAYDFFSDCCETRPQLPPLYKGIRPTPTWSLRACSALHAASMSLILVNIFYNIEDSRTSHFNWFFWTFSIPYGTGVFYRYYRFFEYGQVIEQTHHQLEGAVPQVKRQALEISLKKFAWKRLRELSEEDLRDIHATLTNPHSTIPDKLQAIYRVVSVGQVDLQGPDPQPQRNDLTTHMRNIYRPWSLKRQIAKQLTNLFFYTSVIGEYMLYKYGIGLTCTNFGISSPLAKDIVSNLSATILSAISFLFESNSVRKYYKTTIDNLFHSSNSASNPNIRMVNTGQSFLMSSVIALSEVYPAWKNTLASDSVSYPLIVFMATRHLARGSYWSSRGFDRGITNWHLRRCCNSRKPNVEEMIDRISSQHVLSLMSCIDLLNEEGINEIYKAYFPQTINL